MSSIHASSNKESRTPLWLRRGLVYPQPVAEDAVVPPMWDRPPTRGPIFAEVQLSPSNMWDTQRSPASPLFVTEDGSSSSPHAYMNEIWNRPKTPSSSCPCCLDPVEAVTVPPLPPLPRSLSAGTTGRPQTSRASPTAPPVPGLKKMKSSMSLRMKKSLRSLRRHRADDSAA